MAEVAETSAHRKETEDAEHNDYGDVGGGPAPTLRFVAAEVLVCVVVVAPHFGVALVATVLSNNNRSNGFQS